MQRLQAFTYISTCYVNAHRPPGSHIEEALYPLVRKSTGGKLHHAELAAELAQMAPAKAEKAVSPDSLTMHLSAGPWVSHTFCYEPISLLEPDCILSFMARLI